MSIQFRTRSESFHVDPTKLFGACCTDTCDHKSLSDCYRTSGRFHPNQTCEVVDCDTGVCCKEGLCYNTTAEGCDHRGGNFIGKDFDCFSYNCCEGSTAETQACCFHGPKENTSDPSVANVPYCLDLKACECLQRGGTPRGPNTNCTAIDAAGGCGVTGATARGACCVDGQCLGFDIDNLQGFTPGYCSRLGGYYGGSGSTCGSGTPFDRSWPCSWPTGSCCFGNDPFSGPGGITYCSSGVTYGDCMNNPSDGGSGGSAWYRGTTCGGLLTENLCNPPRSGICCIPQVIEIVIGGNPKELIYDYNCYSTTETACSGVGTWHESESSCETTDCCEYMAEEYQEPCEDGGLVACCSFNTSNGEFISCTNLSALDCHLIDVDPSNGIDTVATYSDANDQTNPCSGNPCTNIPLTGNCCCVWDLEGNHKLSVDINSGDVCPPIDSGYNNSNSYSRVSSVPCENNDGEPLASCETMTTGSCCINQNNDCLNVIRFMCDELDGDFYEGKNCNTDCDDLPCCSSFNNLTACGPHSNENEPNVCINSIDYPFENIDEAFIQNEFEHYFGNNYDEESIDYYGDDYLFDKDCESCGFSCNRNRGFCCWGLNENRTCIPNITQDECFEIGGSFDSCYGRPFSTIEEAFTLENPSSNIDCSEPDNYSRFPSAPINLSAVASIGHNKINVRHVGINDKWPEGYPMPLRGLNSLVFYDYVRYDERGCIDAECSQPDSGGRRWIDETQEIDGVVYPKYYLPHGPGSPPYVFLKWKDKPASLSDTSPRNKSGISCINHNKTGCAPLNKKGTCCVKTSCINHTNSVEDKTLENDPTAALDCFRCIENISECECADLANLPRCKSAKESERYTWTEGSTSCSSCPCNIDNSFYQINDCDSNVINRDIYLLNETPED